MAIFVFIIWANARTAPAGSSLNTWPMNNLYARFMPGFIRGNPIANPVQPLLARAFGQITHVPVGDLRRPLLKGRINESTVRIIGGVRIEPIVDQMMDRGFDRTHVHTPGQVKVFVEQITMPVFFRGPASTPARPRRIARPGRVAETSQPI